MSLWKASPGPGVQDLSAWRQTTQHPIRGHPSPLISAGAPFRTHLPASMSVCPDIRMVCLYWLKDQWFQVKKEFMSLLKKYTVSAYFLGINWFNQNCPTSLCLTVKRILNIPQEKPLCAPPSQAARWTRQAWRVVTTAQTCYWMLDADPFS